MAATPPSRRAPYSVFISHSSADAWTAKQLQRAIEGLGAATFCSVVDVHGGDDFGVAMRDALERADECVVLYTPEAAQSKNVLVEIGGAWTLRKRVVLVLCRVEERDVAADPRFPAYLKSLDFVDLNQELDTEYLPQLRDRIRGRQARG